MTPAGTHETGDTDGRLDTYAGCCKVCGGWRMLIVTDPPLSDDELAERVGKMILAGYEVRRVASADIRSRKLPHCTVRGGHEEAAS